MWQQTKQLNMWNMGIESIKALGREAKQTNMWKQKQNKRENKN